jgi:D-arabinitol 2-dehydrogenase
LEPNLSSKKKDVNGIKNKTSFSLRISPLSFVNWSVCLVIVNMFKQGAWRLANRTCNRSHCITSSTSFLRNTICQTSRSISHTPRLREKTAGDKYHDASIAAECGAAGQHEGSASRTNNQISFEYPDEQEVPRSKVVQGRGGFHMKRTLPSFSLEGKVAVVTGRARGLGLVMG